MPQNPPQNPGDADRRRHVREDSRSVALRIGDSVHLTSNWSLGGALIEDYAGPLTLGSLLTVTEVGQGADRLQRVRIRARVVRREGSTLAVAFLGLDDAAVALFRRLEEQHRPAVPRPDHGPATATRRPSVFAYADRWPPRRAPGAGAGTGAAKIP